MPNQIENSSNDDRVVKLINASSRRAREAESVATPENLAVVKSNMAIVSALQALIFSMDPALVPHISKKGDLE